LLVETVFYGAVGAVVVMTGAIGAHVTQLGFEGEMGSLAALAVVTWVFALALAITQRP